MPDDTPLPPAPGNDAELRETLDLLGTVVASLSDRVDAQAATLERLTATAAETRAAAFHASRRTDLRPLGDAIVKVMDGQIRPLAGELRGLGRKLEADRVETKRQIDGLVRGASAAIEERRRRLTEAKARSRAPLYALLAIGLIIATTLVVPGALAALSGELGCRLLGGVWYGASGFCQL